MNQSLDDLVAEIAPLRRYGRSLAGSRAAADDLVQDTLERAIQKFHLFEPRTKLRLWLFTIMRNIFLDHYRKARKLGTVPLDTQAIAGLLDLPGVMLLNPAFDNEHCLEVHLPFLQHLFHDFSLVPLIVGDAPPEAVEAVLERLWGGPETLIVVSSDLSHYESYERARRLDGATAKLIETHRHEKLSVIQPPSGGPMAGAVTIATL